MLCHSRRTAISASDILGWKPDSSRDAARGCCSTIRMCFNADCSGRHMSSRGSAHETSTYERISIFTAKMEVSLLLRNSVLFFDSVFDGSSSKSPLVPFIRIESIWISRVSAAQVTRLSGINSALRRLCARATMVSVESLGG